VTRPEGIDPLKSPGRRPWALCLILGGTVALLPDAEAALAAMAAHDGMGDEVPKWTRCLRRKLVLEHGEVVPPGASAAAFVSACLRHEVAGGSWLC
jgi:hypothetical protein